MSGLASQPNPIHVLYATGAPRRHSASPLADFFSAFARLEPEHQKACFALSALSLESERPDDFDYEDSALLRQKRLDLQRHCEALIEDGFMSEVTFVHFLTCTMLGWAWHFANPQGVELSVARLRRVAEISGEASMEELANNRRGEALSWQKRYEALCTVVVQRLLEESELA